MSYKPPTSDEIGRKKFQSDWPLPVKCNAKVITHNVLVRELQKAIYWGTELQATVSAWTIGPMHVELIIEIMRPDGCMTMVEKDRVKQVVLDWVEDNLPVGTFVQIQRIDDAEQEGK